MTIHRFTTPSQPADEERRMGVVRSYGLDRADLPPDPMLDTIVAGVAAHFATPVVLVSIITEDRQCFRASIGLGAVSTPRSTSFCGHTILNSTPLIVRDTLLDERFAGNPLVIGAPHIRAYAGAPLVGPEELVIGTLCIIDMVARDFDDADEAALVGFAGAIMARLERLRP